MDSYRSGYHATAPNGLQRRRAPDGDSDFAFGEGEERRDKWRSDDVVVEDEFTWRAQHSGQPAPVLPSPVSSSSHHTHSAPHNQLPPPSQYDPLFSEEDEGDDDYDDGCAPFYHDQCHTAQDDKTCRPAIQEEFEKPFLPIKIVPDIGRLVRNILGFVVESVRVFLRNKIYEFEETQRFSNDSWKGIATCLLGGSVRRDKMTRRVVDYRSAARIALESRIILLVIQVVLTNLSFIPRHQNDGFKFTPEPGHGKVLDNLVYAVFGGGSNWDGQFFLHIAVNGYTKENMLAFFPLFPMLLYMISRPIYLIFWWCLSLSSIIIVVGWCLNTILFMKTAQALHKITECFKTRYGHTLTSTAVIIFCFNPASVFFSSLYTESLFSFLTTNVILSLIERKTFWALFWASLSTLCRSNGLLNFGFIMFYWIQEENDKPVECVTSVVTSALKTISKRTPLILPFLIPFLLFQNLAILKFCDSSKNDSPDYCEFYVLPYAYVQKKYWDVGFMRYFQLKQIPNFVLAFPVLYFTLTESWRRFRSEVLEILYGYTLENAFSFFPSAFGMFLAVFCFVNIHVQVSTRLIFSAFPYIFVYLAESCCLDIFQIRSYESEWPVTAFCIHCWCLAYFLLGGILFPLGYPWT